MPATFLLLCVGLYLATQGRVEWRYWNFLVPPVVIVTIAACARVSRAFVWFALVYGVLIGLNAHWDIARTEIRYVPEEYAIIKRFVPAGGILMTEAPCEVAFHTRRKAVALPDDGDETTILQLANRFRADDLMVSRPAQSNHRDDPYDKYLASEPPGWLDPIYRDDLVLIGRIRRQ